MKHGQERHGEGSAAAALNWARRILAAAILAGFGSMVALLAPVYWNHWRFERELRQEFSHAEALAQSSAVIREQVLERAAAHGIPLRPEHVRVWQEPGRTEVEVVYPVRVELGFYTVDLHFRARLQTRATGVP